MNNQFKFKPDKNKYLSNVDTLDSTHKKIIDEFNKKREDMPKKMIKLDKLKNELKELDYKKNEYENILTFIDLRTKLIENISKLEEEIDEINNYEDETDYYSKTYQILFNYYDILEGQVDSEININTDNTDNINNNTDNINNNTDNINNNTDNIDKNTDKNTNDNKNLTNSNNLIDEWEFDGTQIFNSSKNSKLDILNEMSKKKKKEKKNTRKRVKNVESLIQKNNYDIFEFINSGNNSLNPDKLNKINEYSVFDRAKLYDDYKNILEGYNSKKKYSKICDNCNIDKILIYSEGIYACMKCGEVENCIIENEITNYKEPMVEKPTFPYKRKNHFCEWTSKSNINYFLDYRKIIYIIFLCLWNINYTAHKSHL